MKHLLSCFILLLVGTTCFATTTVYIAIRSDGLPGSGSQSDPYDGSTEAKFDGLMSQFGPSTTINLGTGTFMTYGETAFMVKDGWTINGAGMGVTVIKLAGHADFQNRFCNIAGDQVSNIVISNLTLDGNARGWSWTPHWGVGGLFISGSYNTIDHVECINCYGDTVESHEQFSILVCGGPGQIATHLLVENCLTHNYAPGANYTNGVMISTCTNSKTVNCMDDGSNHAFGSTNSTDTEIIGCSASTKSGNGFYTDTGPTIGLLLQGNTFTVSQIPIQFNSSDAENIKIINNTLSASDIGGVGAAIALTGSMGDNIEIIGNTYDYTGTWGGGLILNNGQLFKDLDVENNSSNVGLIGCGGVMSDVTDVSTLSGNILNEPASDFAADEASSGANTPDANPWKGSSPSSPDPTTPEEAQTAVTSTVNETPPSSTPDPSTTVANVPTVSTSATPAKPAPAAPAAPASFVKSLVQASTLGRGPAKTILMARTLNAWVIQNPAAAANYVQAMKDGSEKMEALQLVAYQWETIDPINAMKWLISLQDIPKSNRLSRS